MRTHWAVENKVHWVPDVTFDEDRSQVRTNHLPRMVAAVSNIIIISWFRFKAVTDIAERLRCYARYPADTITQVLTSANTTFPGLCAASAGLYDCFALHRYQTTQPGLPPPPVIRPPDPRQDRYSQLFPTDPPAAIDIVLLQYVRGSEIIRGVENKQLISEITLQIDGERPLSKLIL